MPDWTFISNHGLVLAYVAKHPQRTIREIASAIKITEWTVYKIITELEREGYIERQKVGRRNTYYVKPHSNLRHETVRHIKVKDLLLSLGWKQPENQAG
ncbi:MAG: helix-turn-helix domain-containing protein [Chloroflexota bacterium]